MAYRRVLAQRNATLQEIRARRASKALLAPWDAQLIQYGWDIARHRGELVAQLAEVARTAYRGLTGGSEVLDCRYLSGAGAGAAAWEEQTESRWKARFEAALAERAAKDAATGATGCGPHRDDLLTFVSGRNAGRFASQGQQRSAVLSLKLAERAALRARLGCVPLFLADDVLSELDLGRRGALHEILLGEGQVFLTATDAEVDGMPRTGTLFRIQVGPVVTAVPRA
jgi:DNA replication and repair protein RecF